MTTTETADTIVAARARAFRNEGARTHKFLVSGGEVRVWDPVAGHYTLCHSLSPAAQRRIRAMAQHAE